MRLVNEACRRKPEVLAGQLREEEFPARLNRALWPTLTAPRAHADPALFFSCTLPTGGLRTLLQDVPSRFSGEDPSAPAIIRLETGFGRGKTHNPIAPAHAVGDRALRDLLTPSELRTITVDE